MDQLLSPGPLAVAVVSAVLAGTLVFARTDLRWILRWRASAVLRARARAARSEVRLAESEQRFKDFAEASFDWFWEMGPDLRFTFRSQPLHDIPGLDPAYMIGKCREELSDPSLEPEKWAHHFADLQARRPFRNFTYKLALPNQSHRYISVSGKPIFGAVGQFLGYRGTGRDVTAEMEAENRANIAQRRLSTAVETLSDGLALFDADDRLITCNETFKRIIGPASHLAVPGTNFEDLLRAAAIAGRFPQAGADPEAFIRERMAYHRRPSGVVQRHLSDGTWVQIREQHLPDGSIGLIATDITDLKRQQAEYARKTATLEATLANMSEGIAVYDFDHRLIAFNDRWKAMLRFPDHIARAGVTFQEVLTYMARRGDFGMENQAKAIARRIAQARTGKPHRHARWYANGGFMEVRRTPMPDGGFISVIADLSELKAAEEQFKDFAEATSDWFWEQDADLRFTYVSTGVYEKSGIPAEFYIGKTQQETEPLGVSDEQWAAHLANLQAQRPFRGFRFQCIDPRGQRRTLSVSGKPIFARDGQFKGYRGSGVDITEQIEAEARAKLAQVRFGSAIESLRDAIAIFDADDRLVMCNAAYRDAAGGSEEIVRPGRTFEEIVRFNVTKGRLSSIADKEAFIAQRLAQHRNPGEPLQMQRDDGGWLQIREQRLADGGAAVIGADITAAKLREQELIDKTEIFQRTLANMGEGIIVFDRDLKLLAWNERAVELLDLPPGFLQMGLDYEAYLRMQAERGEFVDENIDEAVRTRVARAREQLPFFVGRRRPNGKFIELRRNPMPGGGFVALYSDATERKQAEDAMREAKEAAEIANRTKSEFLANMSHELRTPLNAIIGFSEIIQQELFGPIGSSRYKEYASDIYESGTHLLNLINDILDVSKAEAGKVELHETRVRISEVIEASLRLIMPRAREAGIHVAAPAVEHLPLLIADERRLKQVLLNLLSNAVKFTPSGGRVTLEASVDEARGFVVHVIDSGIGMAAQDIPKALEPFGQVDSKLARKYEGTGLGLPLSKALVELHGGELRVESELGVGTTVTVILPAARMVPQESGSNVHHFRRQSR